MSEIMILGGGAAGLMAAICAKEENPAARVTLLEAGDRVGKKLLSTGNGRCNLTNALATEADYAPADVRGVLKGRSPEKLLEHFARMGLVCRCEGEGRVYPVTDAASSVLDTLRLTGAHLGVVERTGFCAERVRVLRGGFEITAQDGKTVTCDRLILATGGQAASRFSGYGIARALGHSVTPLAPGLVPIKTDPARLKGLNGVRCKCAATLLCSGRALLREAGEVLFKDYGLSGIVIFQLSRALARCSGRCEIELDLMPELTNAQAVQLLENRARTLSWRGMDALFLGMLHKNLAANLLRSAGVDAARAADLTPAQIGRLAQQLKHWTHPVTGTQGFANAQVTVGGVPMGEVDGETLASRVCPGLYLAGEVLDVDGPCGGYNLNWAWASGMAAGQSAAREAAR